MYVVLIFERSLSVTTEDIHVHTVQRSDTQ